MERRTDWYRFPAYYEAIFGPDTPREVEFLQGVNALYGTGGRTFLEPGCGSGRLVKALAGRGLELVGCDLSPQMLAYARARLTAAERRRVHLEQAPMEAFCPPRWEGRIDLAYSLVSTFRYLDSEAKARAHLRSVRRLLRPGGVYVLGFHLTDYSRQGYEHERWTGEAGAEKVVCNTREWPPDRARRRSRMRSRLRIVGASRDLLVETEWFFRTWDEAQAEALLARSGFELVALYDFGSRLDRPMPWESNRLDRILILRPRGR